MASQWAPPDTVSNPNKRRTALAPKRCDCPGSEPFIRLQDSSAGYPPRSVIRASGPEFCLEEARRKADITSEGARRETERSASDVLRDLEIKLAPIEIRAELARLTPPPAVAPADAAADVFICHASEDKDDIALPLANALIARGYTVWLDKFVLKLGDRLLDRIDDGIASCRFGIVILSPKFFEKKWTKRELSGLAAREDAEERPLILPIRHNIDQAGLARRSPLLAAILGADWSEGLDAIVAKIVDVLGPPTSGRRSGSGWFEER
jgi:hypothetical protein